MYKDVSIYIDKNGTIIAIPLGKSKIYGIAEIDLIFELKGPYTDEELEVFLMGAMAFRLQRFGKSVKS